MMDANDENRIYGALDDIRKEQSNYVREFATLAQSVKDQNERLFAGMGWLANQNKEIVATLQTNKDLAAKETAAACATCAAATKVLDEKVGKIQTKIKVYAASASGFAVAAGIFGRSALAKIGIHLG